MKPFSKCILANAFLLCKGIKGLLDLDEALFLFNIAQSNSGLGSIVEIGTFYGRSAAWLAWGNKLACTHSQDRVITVDIGNKNAKLKDLIGNLRKARVQDSVIVVADYSEHFARKWSGPIRLLFIDGSHEYEDVKKDFTNWFPHISDGGVIAFHDSYFPYIPEYLEVSRVVGCHVLSHSHITHAGVIGTITFAQKNKANTLQHFRNTLLLLLLRHFQRIANIGKPRIAFWLSLMLNCTDSKVLRIMLATYANILQCRNLCEKQSLMSFIEKNFSQKNLDGYS